MRKVKINSYIGIAIVVAFFSCARGTTISPAESQTIQNLRAFAKLYGYVKYFHPSDEASAIDWDEFAIYGAKQVKDAKNRKELKTALEGLFLPIAPTIQIYTSEENPQDPMKQVPDDTTGLKIVAWQHRGLGLNSPYVSVRLNGKTKLSGSSFVGKVMQRVDAAEYRGKQIRLKAFVKTNVSGAGNQGQLLLWVLRKDSKPGFFENMADRPIKSKEWQAYEITGDVAEDATGIIFECSLSGTGQLWVDEFELFSKDEKDKWEGIKIENHSFEEWKAKNKPEGWIVYVGGAREYSFKIDIENPYKGKKCLLIEGEGKIRKLFEEHPKIGEVVNKALNAGLFCQIPLALYSDENGTLGKDEKYPLAKLLEKLEAVPAGKLTANDEDVRLADVIIAWNVFQHFYPYFDVVDVDWNLELTNALRRAMTDKNEEDFYYTLCGLIAKLQDGHGSLIHKIQREWASLPFRTDWIEDQVVVTVTKDTTKVHKGDIIVSVDGIDAEQALLDAEEYISGSPQWRRFRASQRFGYGDKDSKANLTIKRGNEIFQLQMERNRSYTEQISELKRPKIDKIQDEIYYVDLARAKMPEIEERMDDLANAKGVIFDLRGYPQGNDDVICHLLREEDISDAWMRIPQIIYPDFENVVGYKNSGWGLKPKQPRIKGKVVFLTDGRAISYAESFMSFIEHYKLAEIVGQPTAGTNGNVNRLFLPGDFRIRWTGMKVVKHDGSQHHLIGIKPTVPVRRTIQGVIEGRDEFLEKALEIINKQ